MAYAQILIIDENERARTQLAQQLKDLAYDVHTATSLTDALAKLKTAINKDQPYECICLGPMEKTGGNGHKAFHTIRGTVRGYEETLILGGSHDESYWSRVKNENGFLPFTYDYEPDTEIPLWDTHTLRNYLPEPKVMATI